MRTTHTHVAEALSLYGVVYARVAPPKPSKVCSHVGSMRFVPILASHRVAELCASWQAWQVCFGRPPAPFGPQRLVRLSAAHLYTPYHIAYGRLCPPLLAVVLTMCAESLSCVRVLEAHPSHPPHDMLRSCLSLVSHLARSWPIRTLLREEGAGALYRGIAPAMLRAFPANAACFFGVDLAKSILGSAAL